MGHYTRNPPESQYEMCSLPGTWAYFRIVALSDLPGETAGGSGAQGYCFPAEEPGTALQTATVKKYVPFPMLFSKIS